MQLQQIALIIFAGFVGFGLNILRNRIYEKKVDISHEIEKPSIFSSILPTICFQNLRILNKGNQPAKELCINLNATAITECNAIFNASLEEPYEQEIKGRVLVLKFSRLLPKEGLILSFKSDKPLPDDFLLSVKSNEMISRSINVGGKAEWSTYLPPLLIMVVGLFGVLLVAPLIVDFMDSVYKKIYPKHYSMDVMTKEQPLRLSLITDRNIYKKGQKIEIIYRIANLRNETLNDLKITLKILDNSFQNISSLKKGDEIKYKKSFIIPKNIVSGAYLVSLVASTEGQDSVRAEELKMIEIEAPE